MFVKSAKSFFPLQLTQINNLIQQALQLKSKVTFIWSFTSFLTRLIRCMKPDKDSNSRCVDKGHTNTEATHLDLLKHGKQNVHLISLISCKCASIRSKQQLQLQQRDENQTETPGWDNTSYEDEKRCVPRCVCVCVCIFGSIRLLLFAGWKVSFSFSQNKMAPWHRRERSRPGWWWAKMTSRFDQICNSATPQSQETSSGPSRE